MTHNWTQLCWKSTILKIATLTILTVLLFGFSGCKKEQSDLDWGPDRNGIQVHIEPVFISREHGTANIKIMVRNQSNKPQRVPNPSTGQVNWYFGEIETQRDEMVGANPGRGYPLVTLEPQEIIADQSSISLPKQSGEWKLTATISSYPGGRKFKPLKSNTLTINLNPKNH